jgi:hypothetical protein
MTQPGITQAQQNLIDQNPVQGGEGTAGVAAGEAARLMAALEMLNGQFKQAQQELQKMANTAAMSEASAQKSQGIASAIGAGVGAAFAVAAIAHASYQGYQSNQLQKTQETQMEEIQQQLKENKTKLTTNTSLTSVHEGEAAAAAAGRAEATPPISKDQLKLEREKLRDTRDDLKSAHEHQKSQQKTVPDIRQQGLAWAPQGATGFASAASQSDQAQATQYDALNKQSASAESSLDDARKNLNQTGQSMTQINWFAGAAAAAGH